MDFTCPWCSAENTEATCLENESIRPKPGDFNLCIKCAGLGVFTETDLRRATADEKASAIQLREFRRLSRAILRLNERSDG